MVFDEILSFKWYVGTTLVVTGVTLIVIGEERKEGGGKGARGGEKDLAHGHRGRGAAGAGAGERESVKTPRSSSSKGKGSRGSSSKVPASSPSAPSSVSAASRPSLPSASPSAGSEDYEIPTSEEWRRIPSVNLRRMFTAEWTPYRVAFLYRVCLKNGTRFSQSMEEYPEFTEWGFNASKIGKRWNKIQELIYDWGEKEPVMREMILALGEEGKKRK
jgi:hypothetical protein